MPWANVTANVRLPLTLAHAGAGAGEAVTRWIDRVGLADFAQSYPRELSGGMKMRASIARALVTEPRLLLMDEPFAALDEITRFKLNNELAALWHELRRTVIFVTHSVFELVYLVAAHRGDDAAARPRLRRPQDRRAFPRDERFRTSSDYAGYCRVVAEALAKAMGGAA